MASEAGMLRQWRWRHAGVDSAAVDALARQLNVPLLLAQLLLVRDISDPQQAGNFLNPRLTALHDPALLPGIDCAAERILDAVRQRHPIVIYGDYDVDGITASAILWHMLTALGAVVSTYVPHRIDEGYGLSSDALAGIAGQSSPPPLVISVDCGVTALEPAAAARDLGIDLIITDHHELPAGDLPVCHSLVHPRLPESRYPFGDLCGAGVAFKLAWHVARRHAGSERLPEVLRSLLLDLLSLAALGTIADVVPLVDENRVLATFGLGQVKRTRFAGLNAMIDAASLRDEKIDAYHVGFVLGPRLNACGRMGHARDAVTLFTEAGPADATRIAAELTTANQQRRDTERRIFTEARQLVRQRGMDRDDRRAIVLGQPDWHAGVIGIVASRLVEEFNRPVVLLNIDNGEAHGSARSVPGVALHEVLHHCRQHLTSYGGHAMAAGMRLSSASVDAFTDMLIARVNDLLTPEDLRPSVDIDAECRLAELTVPLLRMLNQLAPHGRGNPAPVLCLREMVISHPPTCVGRDNRHLRLTLRQDDRAVNAVGFGLGDLAERLAAGDCVDLVVRPKLDHWQGRETVDLHVVDVAKKAADGIGGLGAPSRGASR